MTLQAHGSENARHFLFHILSDNISDYNACNGLSDDKQVPLAFVRSTLRDDDIPVVVAYEALFDQHIVRIIALASLRFDCNWRCTL